MYTVPHHMTITEFRKNAAKAADMVVEDGVPLIITRGSKEPLAVIPYNQLAGYAETEYLRNHPGYGKELLERIEEYRSGKAKLIHKTIEELEALATDH